MVRPRGFGVLDLPSRAARETRVRPSLLDLCHGAGRSSPAAARASKLGACFSAHRARGPARATQTSKTAACAVIRLHAPRVRVRRAPHTPPARTSVRTARIHPSPTLAAAGWAAGAVRLAAEATLCNASTHTVALKKPEASHSVSHSATGRYKGRKVNTSS